MCTIRNNIWGHASLRDLQHAGRASRREQRYREIAAAERYAATGLRRGDILATMLNGRLVVLDGLITHAWAPAYVAQACHTNGHAAALQASARRAAFAKLRTGAGSYKFVQLAAESGGAHRR